MHNHRNTADETLKGNGFSKNEDPQELRHKLKNSTFQDILQKIDSEGPHVATGIARILTQSFSYLIAIPFFEIFVPYQEAFRDIGYSVIPCLKIFHHSGDPPFHHSVE